MILVMIEMVYLEGSIKGEKKVYLRYQVAVLQSNGDASQLFYYYSIESPNQMQG